MKTLVLHNTGVLNDGPGAIPGMDVRKDVLQTVHTPAIYILGGPKDIAYANGMDDFRRIFHVPVAVANLPVGHGGTFNEPNGGAAASVAVSWLDWQLRGDAQSGKRFVGDDCGLCKDAQWSLERKQFPGTAPRGNALAEGMSARHGVHFSRVYRRPREARKCATRRSGAGTGRPPSMGVAATVGAVGCAV